MEVAGNNSEILVVEDTPASLALLSRILGGAGYGVRQASDGDLALWTLGSRLPDLILLDVHMPGMDGFEVCRRVKADPATAEVPVIILSALDATEDKVQGLALGAVDYITKPYRAEEVLARVNTHITLARLRKTVELERGRLEQRVAQRTLELEGRTRELTSILAAMDMAGDGIAVVDRDGRIHYANQALVGTIGASGMESLLGRRPEDLSVADRSIFDMAEIETLRRAVRRDGQWRGELSIRSRNSRTPARLLVHVRELPDGGRVAVMTDVTEARRREEERKRLERELEQARRLEALGQLAGGVAHDFNNLLGAILGFAQFIAEDSRPETPQNRHAGRIIRAGRQAKSLIGQILAFSHRREAVPEPVDLPEMVRENLSILKAVLAENVALSFEPGDGAAVAAGQRDQIVQVLINLAVNGSEAMHGRPGSVRISTGGHDPGMPGPERFRVQAADTGPVPLAWTDGDGLLHAGIGCLEPDGRYVRLSVADDGDGMDADTLSRIFAPFFTTKGTSGGSGLGLAVVLGVVTSHRGAAMVSTRPGQGTRFDVFLPRAEDGLEHPAPEAEVPPAMGEKGSILLVDDSTHFGDMLMTALFRLGYEVAVCDDPAEALGYVEEDPDAWDMVITDQVMMNMTGTELVAAVKRIRPDLPCIICTAFPAGIGEAAAREAGAEGFATKPLDLGRFSLMVRDILAPNGPP